MFAKQSFFIKKFPVVKIFLTYNYKIPILAPNESKFLSNIKKLGSRQAWSESKIRQRKDVYFRKVGGG